MSARQQIHVLVEDLAIPCPSADNKAAYPLSVSEEIKKNIKMIISQQKNVFINVKSYQQDSYLSPNPIPKSF